MITFSFEGKTYVVGNHAYDVEKIVLPNGKLIEAAAWLESFPAQPKGLHEVHHEFALAGQMEIARRLNAAVAIQARYIELGEFAYLKPGDKVFYAAGTGSNHVEALAIINDQPSVSVEIIISEIVYGHGIQVDEKVYASPQELFRVQ